MSFVVFKICILSVGVQINQTPAGILAEWPQENPARWRHLEAILPFKKWPRLPFTARIEDSILPGSILFRSRRAAMVVVGPR
jgi:hypothetical protein